MTLKIYDGDYVFDSAHSSFEIVDNIDELMQLILMHLTIRRGSFYPNKNYGSFLRAEELKEPKNEYALAFARQALDSLGGVYVKSAQANDDFVVLNILINNNVERQVRVKL